MANEGDFGELLDLVIDDADWSIAGLMIGGALPGGPACIAPDAVAGIDFIRRILRLRVSREQMRPPPRMH